MNNLKQQVQESAEQLKKIWTLINGATSTKLPSQCYQHWISKAKFHYTLSSTEGLFKYRNDALIILKSLTTEDHIVDREKNTVQHGPRAIDFAIARHLAFTSYMATTWSIYDRLSNVCGRISCTSKLSSNPRTNPKLFEDFLNNKNNHIAFDVQSYLKAAYAWPLKISYKLRNWLVHEGYEEGSIKLFKGNSIDDAFIMHDDAIEQLEKVCGYVQDDGKVAFSCLTKEEECWHTKNLLVISEKYNNEIDILFKGLVKWNIDSFTGQISAFAERDKSSFITSTT